MNRGCIACQSIRSCSVTTGIVLTLEYNLQVCSCSYHDEHTFFTNFIYSRNLSRWALMNSPSASDQLGILLLVPYLPNCWPTIFELARPKLSPSPQTPIRSCSYHVSSSWRSYALQRHAWRRIDIYSTRSLDRFYHYLPKIVLSCLWTFTSTYTGRRYISGEEEWSN